MDQYFDIYLIKGFAKKPNSTKRPEIDFNKEVTTKQKRVRGRLRDGCSIFQPVVEIRWDVKPLKTQGGTDYPDPPYQQADIIAYNYAWIQLFGDYNTATYGDYFDNVHGRYYYITDITINTSGLYQLTLQVDVLATYRDEIGGSTQFVMRCEKKSNNNIADDLSAHGEIRSFDSSSVTLCSGDINTWYSAVITGRQYTASGTGFYLLDSVSAFSQRGSWLYLENDGTTREFTDAEWETFRPMDAVKGAFSLPSEFSPLASPIIEPVYGVGRCTSLLSGFGVGVSSISLEKTLTVPKHPQSNTYPFVKSGKYSDYSLTIPLCGTFAVDADLVSTTSILTISVVVDPLNGQGVLRVLTDERVIYSASVNVASFAAFGYAGTNSAGAAVAQKIANRSANISAISSGIGTVASALTGNIAGAVGGIVSIAATGAQIENNGIRAGIDGAQTTSAGISGGGSRFALTQPCTISASFVEYIPPAGVGRPLYGNSIVSEAGGYITVANPHLDLNANLGEIQAIYQYMEGGFYYE